MRSFGDRLRAVRTAKGLSQEELGFHLGVSKAMVSKYESDDSFPGLDGLRKLHTALGASLDELILGYQEAARQARAVSTIMDASGTYDVRDTARAKDAKEYTLLLRYRAVSGRKKSAVLDLLAPDKEPPT